MDSMVISHLKVNSAVQNLELFNGNAQSGTADMVINNTGWVQSLVTGAI